MNNYYLINREKECKKSKEYYLTHKTQYKEYYLRNKERLLKEAKDYCYTHKTQMKEYTYKNREKTKLKAKERYKKNPNKYREEQKIYRRKYYINIVRNGKLITLRGNKRSYPDIPKCEICKKICIHLAYHHWNDEDISKGIWICGRCHAIITYNELIDKEIILNKYLELKNQVNILTV